MNTLELWALTIADALDKLWASFVTFTPKLLGALLVMVIGIFISVGVARVVRRIVNTLKITTLLRKMHLDRVIERTGIKFDVGQFCYWLTKWFLLIGFFMAAAEIVNLKQVSEFLGKVLFYVPNVIVAVLIMLIGIILANFLVRVVTQSTKATNFSSSAHFLAALTRWSVLIFSFMAALIQLKVAVSLIHTLFTGIIAMVAIAGGIAFGLGGKEEAKKLLKKIVEWRNNQR